MYLIAVKVLLSALTRENVYTAKVFLKKNYTVVFFFLHLLGTYGRQSSIS